MQMKIRTRILVFNLSVICLVIVLTGIITYMEFVDQQSYLLHQDSHLKFKSLVMESLKVVSFAGLVAFVVAYVFTQMFLSKALEPISKLTHIFECTNIDNLSEPVPRNANGDELDRMAVMFNRLKSRLDASFTQSREFTINASHELKTPLSIMHGILEQMINSDELDEKNRARIESIIEEVQRLYLLSNQLIFLSKVDTVQWLMNQDEIRMSDLIREIHEDCTELARGKSIQVDLGECEPVWCDIDRSRIRQMLLNLADNAVKYSDVGGRIVISMKVVGPWTLIRFANSGEVIPLADRERIFDRFYRVDKSHSSTVEGSGLGLSIVEAIVRMHGGEISYDVDECGLNCFDVKLVAKRVG